MGAFVLVWKGKRPWWRYFVVLPENEKELEAVYKMNLTAIAGLSGMAGFFLTLMLFSVTAVDTLKFGFLFIGSVLLIMPLVPDSLLSSMEYNKRKLKH